MAASSKNPMNVDEAMEHILDPEWMRDNLHYAEFDGNAVVVYLRHLVLTFYLVPLWHLWSYELSIDVRRNFFTNEEPITLCAGLERTPQLLGLWHVINEAAREHRMKSGTEHAHTLQQSVADNVWLILEELENDSEDKTKT